MKYWLVKSEPDVGSTFTVVLQQHREARNEQDEPKRDTIMAERDG